MARARPDKDWLVERVLEHALNHFDESPHWAHVVESFTDAQVLEAIGDATTAEQAIASVARVARRVQDQAPTLGVVTTTPDPDGPEPEPAQPERELTELQRRLVKAVKDHAMANYNTDGWDYIVESFTDREIAAEIGKARTEKGAIRAVRAVARLLDERRRDIQSTAF
jgi:hypothetical protein